MSDTQPSTRPTCPFCQAEWTDEMIEQFDLMQDPNACSCCAGPASQDHVHREQQPAVPLSDLCCAHCKRAIYLAPQSLVH